ncbi:MAG: DUF72 domain-containing protein [Phaeodactylibacter sp.]|nr:DUF72 domain-containing protein [Phaeodactylibacter sp.]MCB9291684.1 DUF72 domain-containing protein [Lewinellaceae bacterium]
MKFGKLPDISGVDFSLPPDSPENSRLLAGLPEREGPPLLHIGCTGWSMKEWVGRVYPRGTKAKDYLRAYSRQFNTIELNTTHYRIPDAATVGKWYEESAPDFRFCPKVPQSISHSRNLGLGTELIPSFCEAVLGLREKLGCCFMQMPPYFDTRRLPQLEKFLKALPGELPLAVELRHESWFSGPKSGEAAFSMFQEHRAAAVITDVAGRRDVLHMRLTSGAALVRFVGNGLHPTDYHRVDEWVQRLAGWFEKGLREVFFFPHEPDNLLAPELAAYVLEKAREKIPGMKTRGPNLSGEEGQGQQMSLF